MRFMCQNGTQSYCATIVGAFVGEWAADRIGHINELFCDRRLSHKRNLRFEFCTRRLYGNWSWDWYFNKHINRLSLGHAYRSPPFWLWECFYRNDYWYCLSGREATSSN